MIFKKGRMLHSYIINFLGIRIRFRNKFACYNNKLVLVDENGNERSKNFKGLKGILLLKFMLLVLNLKIVFLSAVIMLIYQ